MEQKKSVYTVQHSMIAKGIFIIMLLMHHVFYGSAIGDFGVETVLKPETLWMLSTYGKICVGGFAFISAYGMALQLRKSEKPDAVLVKTIWRRRLVKLESACLFIYPIAVLYKRLVVGQEVKEVFSDGTAFQPVYMILDAVGLADFLRTPRLNVTWWYLSFAICLILAVPALYYLYRRVGISLFFLALFVFSDKKIAIIILGIAFACEDWFDRIAAYIEQGLIRKIGLFLVCLIGIYTTYTVTVYTQSVESIEWIAGVFVILLATFYLSKTILLSRILAFLGKHSANIFLIHTFIYLYFYEEFIYSFKRAGVILMVLLGLSLAVSVVLELVKKGIRYDRLVQRLAGQNFS